MGLVFYSYKTIRVNNAFYEVAEAEFLAAKKESSKALSKVKEYAVDTEIYKTYQEKRAIQQKKYDKLQEAIKMQKTFGFKSSHFFAERFTKATTNLLFVVFIVFFVGLKNKWHLLIVGVFTSTIFFQYFWIFQKFQDYPPMVYYAMTFITAFIVLFSFWKLKTSVDRRNKKLENDFMQVAKFTFKNTKPDKREEMLNLLKKLATNK